MSPLPPESVYRGFWVDHSRGVVLGSTLTLTSTSANILIAFLSGLVSLSASQFWGILVFVYYCYSTNTKRDTPQDALHHQRQLLVRNTSSPGTAAWNIFKLAKKWEKKTENPWIRCWIPFSLAFLCTIIFTIAAILSSKIVSSSDIKVLISGPTCSKSMNITSVQQQVLESALSYARQCSGIRGAGCDIYPKTTIPYSNWTAVSCPFPGMCVNTTPAAVHIDTGQMNSNDVFGINANMRDRISVRKVTTCAAIREDRPYLTLINDANLIGLTLGRMAYPGEGLYSWMYGSKNGFHRGDSKITPSNMTWYLSNYATSSNYSTLSSSVTSASVIYKGSKGDKTYGWAPINSFKRWDGDTTLLWINFDGVPLLSNSPKPTDPIYDPTPLPGKTSGYLNRASAVNVVGCFEQYQYCNPASTQCTDLSGEVQALERAATDIGLNERQGKVLDLFANVTFAMQIVGEVSPPPLLFAQVFLKPGIIFAKPAPVGQWIQEISFWMSWILISVQQAIFSYAILGTSTPGIPGAPGGSEFLCGSIKMTAPPGFSNASVFGLLFTLTICFLIIIMNTFLLNCVRALGYRRKPAAKSVESWCQDSIFHIQKRAYEGVGVEGWTRKDEYDDIPLLPQSTKIYRLEIQEKLNDAEE